MLTFRQRLSQLVFVVSICVFVFTSCNSSKHMAGTDFQNNSSYSKSISNHYKTKTHKNRQHRSIKCNHKKIIYVNQDNKRARDSEIIKHKTDFTLIILKEQNKFLQNEEYVTIFSYRTKAVPQNRIKW